MVLKYFTSVHRTSALQVASFQNTKRILPVNVPPSYFQWIIRSTHAWPSTICADTSFGLTSLRSEVSPWYEAKTVSSRWGKASFFSNRKQVMLRSLLVLVLAPPPPKSMPMSLHFVGVKKEIPMRAVTGESKMPWSWPAERKGARQEGRGGFTYQKRLA